MGDGAEEDSAVTLALIAISLVVFAVLAVRQSPLWQWGVAALVIGLLTRIDFIGGTIALATDLGGLILVLLPAAILLLLSLEPIRKAVLTDPDLWRGQENPAARLPHRAGSARCRHGRLGRRTVLGPARLEQADLDPPADPVARGTGFP